MRSSASHLVVLAAITGSILGRRIAYPRVLDERGTDGTVVVQVTDNVTLHLEKAALALPRLRLDVEVNGTVLHKVVNGSEVDKHLFVDRKQKSSVMVHLSENGVSLTGIINDELKIQPLAPQGRSLLLSGGHSLDKIDKANIGDLPGKVVPGDLLETNLVAGKEDTFKHSIVYPEVYVIVSSNFANGVPDNDLLRYIIIFLAGVNTKLADLANPKVQLRLVGVLKSQTWERSLQRRGSYILAADTLNHFLRRVITLGVGNPDMYLVLTEEDMIDLLNERYDPRITGISPIGGMCIPGRNALIVEDVFGSYSGNDVATHEFGHMLGAPHDQYQPTYEDMCGWSLGYIMSYVDGGERKYHFSPCSRYLIHKSLSEKDEQCIGLTFVEDYMGYLPGVLPGGVFDGNKFCQSHHRGVPGIYFPPQAPRTLYHCRVTCNGPPDAYGTFLYFTHNAPEGTPCYKTNPAAICELGRCVE